MTDKELFVLLRGLLLQEGPKRGLAGFEFASRYQPTQQGIPKAKAIYMFVTTPKRRYGFRSVTHTPRVPPETGVSRREVQNMETTFQFSVTQPLDISVDGPTHGDTLNLVASVIQSPDFVSEIIKNGASVLRITQVRMANVINDYDQWEENPTFDLTLKHQDVFVDNVPEVVRFQFKLYPL